MAEKMKHILIFSHALELGGAERALIGLLHALDHSRVQVDLFLMRHEGALMDQIPPQVRLLPEKPQYASLAVPLKTVLKKGQLGVALGRFAGKQAARKREKTLGITTGSVVGLEYSHKYTRAFMPQVGDREYDLAVSFLTPHYFVAEKVRARKKIAWIHTDYTRIRVDRESELRMWNCYDHIASISDTVGECFTQVFPELADRLVKIENILPVAVIRHAAAAECPADFPQDASVRLLSIGRYCEAKNFDNVPAICRKIREMGLDVKWYIIGFGGGEDLIRRKIAESAMEDHVIMLGLREDPYPYIAHCDLYVQPSRYEGNSVTVREAQVLAKPVVITRYATSASQLEEGVDGIIVPMDNEGCAAGIAELLRDPEKMKQLSEACHGGDYANTQEAEKLMGLLK
jgi:glycosyltransferase involved in cell wall biosynthesis